MNVQIENLQVERWPAIALANKAFRIVIVPELGGKIISLQSLRTGREWLWKNPSLPLCKPSQLDAIEFGSYDSGGWDEIFPTVNPCRLPDSGWRDIEIIDHGELWCRPWELVSIMKNSKGAATLSLKFRAPELPFQFTRSLSLASGDGPLTLSYQVENLGKETLPYLWAAHPLIAIRPGDVIRLPQGTTMSTTYNVGLKTTIETDFNWPILPLSGGRTLDLSQVPSSTARFAIKVFAENLSPRRIEITDPNHKEGLKICFAGTHVNHCGLWLNYGAWPEVQTTPYYNIGIEPTTSPQDDLSVAVKRGSAPILEVGEKHHWDLTVRIAPQFDFDELPVGE